MEGVVVGVRSALLEIGRADQLALVEQLDGAALGDVGGAGAVLANQEGGVVGVGALGRVRDEPRVGVVLGGRGYFFVACGDPRIRSGVTVTRLFDEPDLMVLFLGEDLGRAGGGDTREVSDGDLGSGRAAGDGGEGDESGNDGTVENVVHL